MIKKEDVPQMLDEWINRLSGRDEEEEAVLMMVRNRVANMPELLEEDDLR